MEIPISARRLEDSNRFWACHVEIEESKDNEKFTGCLGLQRDQGWKTGIGKHQSIGWELKLHESMDYPGK